MEVTTHTPNDVKLMVTVHLPLGPRASRPPKLRPRWTRSQEKAGGAERLQLMKTVATTEARSNLAAWFAGQIGRSADLQGFATRRVRQGCLSWISVPLCQDSLLPNFKG